LLVTILVGVQKGPNLAKPRHIQRVFERGPKGDDELDKGNEWFLALVTWQADLTGYIIRCLSCLPTSFTSRLVVDEQEPPSLRRLHTANTFDIRYAMHLTFSLTTMGLLLGDFVQAGPLTLAGCPDAAQIPTEHGFAAWRWAVGYWGIDAKDENGNAIDTAQVICLSGATFYA
jgi:hypothetical protein